MGQVEEFSIAVPFQEYIEPLHEAIPLAGILAGDVFQVGAQEDQAAGALLAFGGTEAGLSAADLLLQIVALASLSFLQLLFLCLAGIIQGEGKGDTRTEARRRCRSVRFPSLPAGINTDDSDPLGPDRGMLQSAAIGAGRNPPFLGGRYRLPRFFCIVIMESE